VLCCELQPGAPGTPAAAPHGVLTCMLQVYVARAPCAPHQGYGHWLADAWLDYWDFFRELAATAYYYARGWL